MVEKVNLASVHSTFKELMYTEDDCKALDLILATYLSRKQTHSKLWLILVADTGFGKSEITRPLEKADVIKVRKMTPATLVAGRNDNGQHDLAPKLHKKVLMINDMAQILKLPTETKAQLFSQFVDLYDGIATTNAYGVYKDYTDLNVTFIGCSTHAIYNQLLLFSYLGTRFLCYGISLQNRGKLMEKVRKNLEERDKNGLREKYKKEILTYLDNTSYQHIQIPDKVSNQILTWADTLTRLRTTGNSEMTSGELTEIPHEEMPTRIIEQLLTLYRCLKCLDQDYPDKRAMDIIKNVVLSSSNKLRLRILIQAIINKYSFNTPFSRKDIAEQLGMGQRQTFRELNFLTHSGLLKRRAELAGHNKNTGDEVYYSTWEIDIKNRGIQLLIEHLKLITPQWIYGG